MGPIGRSVEDVAAMLDVMAGVGVGKPHWAPAPERSSRLLVRAAAIEVLRWLTAVRPNQTSG